MSSFSAGVLPGHALVALLWLILAVIAIRLADEHSNRPRNHLIVMGGAMFAFGAVYRMADVMAHIGEIRWSEVIGGIGVLAFIAADQRTAPRLAYEGPERRRRPRVGTDPDEDYPRNEAR